MVRMKQARFQALIGDSAKAIGFVPIAGGTRMAQVFKFGPTNERQRKNVFNFKSHNRKSLARPAIGAALREMDANPSPEIDRNIVAQSFSSVLNWRSATAACAFTRLSSSIFFNRRSSSRDSSAESFLSAFLAKRSSKLDWFLGLMPCQPIQSTPQH